ncbi:MAG: stage II sporulation protein P [Clostridia bacterium]|nr:stage II sporulation protein P [Clostridia bacterium]
MTKIFQSFAVRLLAGSFMLFGLCAPAQASMFTSETPAPTAALPQPAPVQTPVISSPPAMGFMLEIISEPHQEQTAEHPFRVLIYHTHTYEAFTATEAYPYTATEKWRTGNPQRNVVALGAYLSELLTQAGMSVTHDTAAYEPPTLSSAYERSLKMLEKRSSDGEVYDLYIDLHRDAYSEGNGPNTVENGGEEIARLMFLIGKGTGQTGAGYDVKPDYESNLTIAQLLTNRLNMQVDNLCRPVKVKTGRYNQHIAPRCVLIEVGNNHNTLEEALCAMPYLANAICSLSDGQIE